MTELKSPIHIATAFIQAFAENNLASVSHFVSEEIVFESPRVQISGIEPYLNAVGQFAEIVQGVNVIASLGDEGQAMIMYDMITIPFGTIRAVDHFLIREGFITMHKLVFDTHEVRKAEEGR